MPITALIICATLAVSFAPIFVKLCEYHGIEPASMSAMRMLLTAIVLLPLARRGKSELLSLTVRERWKLIGGGVLMGAHFILFITAFRLTSFESTVILLASQPLLASVMGRFMLGERISRASAIAMVIAIFGLLAFIWRDLVRDEDLLSNQHLLGDLLVLLCGVAVVLTIIWGRRLRQKLGFGLYTTSLFGIGGLACLAYALVIGEAVLPATPEAWGWMAMLVLVPTILGHGMFNYLVKHVPVFMVNLVILAEPVISILVKYLIDRPEVFGPVELGPIQVVSGAVMILGVAFGLVLRHRGRDLKPA